MKRCRRDYFFSLSVTREVAATFAQEAYLKASNTTASDTFGKSVALEGDTLAVGAPTRGPAEDMLDSSGAVYIFTRSGSTWVQQAYIVPFNLDVGDRFGYSVALSGDTLVIGSPNEDSSTTGINSSSNDLSANSGATYVYTRSGSVWSQQAYIKASNVNEGDEFGSSVAIDGDTLVIGAPKEDGVLSGVNNNSGIYSDIAANNGAVYVYVRDGDIWTEYSYIKTHEPGYPWGNEQFGFSVDISGDTLVVGAINEDSSTTGVNSSPDNNASAAGAVFVFTINNDVWSQQAYIKASNTDASDQFGYSVALLEDTLAVGAIGEDSSTIGINSVPDNNLSSTGAVYVFTRSGNNWSQQAYIKSSNTISNYGFGKRVALESDALAVADTGEMSGTTGINSTPDATAARAGAVYAFTRSNNIWNQQYYIKASNTEAIDLFGIGLSISSDTIAVGASAEDSGTTGVNSVPDESANGAGAVYVFE